MKVDHTHSAAGGEMAPGGEMGVMDDVGGLVRAEVDRDVPSAVHKVLAENGHGAAQAVREHGHHRMTNDDWHLTGQAQQEYQTRHDSGWELHIHYHT